MSFTTPFSSGSFAFRVVAGIGGASMAMKLDEFTSDSVRTSQDSRRSRVFVVDQHSFVRESIVRLLNRQPDLVCCGDAQTIAEAMCGLEKERPDLLLLDLHLSDGNALDLIEFLRPQFPRLVMLVLSHCDEVMEAEKALRAGANGYLLKQDACDEMLNAIRALLIGKLYVSHDIAGRMLTKLLNLPGFAAKAC
jgi:DNA-binding NarL/FixJ family response regulator